MSQEEFDVLMEGIRSKYAVHVAPVRIGDKTLKILQIENLEEYFVDLIDNKNVPVLDLPFWAKVWDASLLLAYFLGKQPVVMGQRMLEIGAGIGVVGVYAALCGHRITITDINEDALDFARANAWLNGATNAEIRKLDWVKSEVDCKYDVIAGSEVVYDRNSYPALVKFLRNALAPDGTIFLAKNAQLNTPAFFAEMSHFFKFKHTIQKIRMDGEVQEIALYAIRHK